MDMLTLLLARKKRVLRLDKYGSDNYTLNDIVLALAMQGGGTVTGVDDIAFWDDVMSVEPQFLVLTLYQDIYITINVFAVEKNQTCFISGTGVVYVEGMPMEVTCLITNENEEGDTTNEALTFKVLATPVDFPTA